MICFKMNENVLHRNNSIYICIKMMSVFSSCVVFVCQIVMPPHLEKVRDRLAENIHELWGMNKIELGWCYGKVSLPQSHKHTLIYRSCVSRDCAECIVLLSLL